MYVSFEDFASVTLGNVIAQPSEKGEENPEPVKPDITEEEYIRLAPMADLLIDHWTLDRVGDAVRGGYQLPQAVVVLYAAIIENLPTVMSESKLGTGGLVSSFSNGIDSYSFDLNSTVEDRLERSLRWMVDALPVDWISSCVSYKGGVHVC